MQLAASMRPAIGQGYFLGRTFEQAIIARISINLQDAAEALQDIVRMLAGTSRCISEGDPGWVLAAPWPVIAGQGPKVSGFGAFAPRGQDRCGCFVHEELG